MPLVATWGRHPGWNNPRDVSQNPVCVVQERLSIYLPSKISNSTFFAEQCDFTPFSDTYFFKMMPLVATWGATRGAITLELG